MAVPATRRSPRRGPGKEIPDENGLALKAGSDPGAAVAAAFARRAATGGIPDEDFLRERANFARLVLEDVKGRVPRALQDHLRAPHRARRWLFELENLARTVDGKLAHRAADAAEGNLGPFDGEGSYERWRARTLHFRSHVAECIAEAEGALEDAGIDPREASPPPPDYEYVLLRVRGYLVGADAMEREARERRRERLIDLVSGALFPQGEQGGNARG